MCESDCDSIDKTILHKKTFISREKEPDVCLKLINWKSWLLFIVSMFKIYQMEPIHPMLKVNKNVHSRTDYCPCKGYFWTLLCSVFVKLCRWLCFLAKMSKCFSGNGRQTHLTDTNTGKRLILSLSTELGSANSIQFIYIALNNKDKKTHFTLLKI